MKVILKDDVKNVGKIGEIVDVADGFARNYLLPKGLAVEANTRNIRSLEHEKRIIEEMAKKREDSAQRLASKISAMSLVIKAKAGEDGKLFGSITNMDIAEALRAKGVEIDKKKISVEEPIRRLGSYTVSVKVHREISAQLNIEVVQE